MIIHFRLHFSVLIIIFLLSGCGGQAPQGETSATDGAIELQPIGNTMRYAVTEFTVHAGQELTIIFNNTATSPAMQHNVVVLENSEIIERVGTAALEAGQESEFIPASPGIQAYTSLAMPGETVRVTFTVPETPGEYPYICTFPAHYMSMQGVMIVEEE